MSSVSRSIAEQVVEGKFRSDKPIRSYRYENIFDGGETFKIVFKGQERFDPNCIAGHNITLWWTLAGGLTK